MAVIATSKSYLSSVLMSDVTSLVPDFNYAQVNLKEAANTTVKLGQLVVWNGTDAFRVLKNTDFTNDTTLTTPAGVSSLPDGAAIGVVVGFNGSLGGEYDATVGTTAVKAHVLFRGTASVKDTHADGGLQFDAGVVTARQATAKRLLEQALIDVKPVLAQVSSSFYGY
jgi:hypothetical protein